jgi:SpoVK/Ycf46/Vps4 family AAA+-type ATPase
LLLFGYSGSGKSLYPEGLAKNFIENSDISNLLRNEKKKSNKINDGFTLFHIKCNDLLSTLEDESSSRRVLSTLEADITKSQPAVVAFDELDAFSPERIKMTPSSAYVFYWTMSFMQKSKRGLTIFGILNQPRILEAAVRSQIDNMFYFRELDKKMTEAILRKRGIPYSAELALRMCTTVNRFVLGNELNNSCEKIIQTIGQGDPRNLAKEKLERIEKVMMTWLKATWSDREEYERINSDYIAMADDAISFWNERYAYFLSHGL